VKQITKHTLYQVPTRTCFDTKVPSWGSLPATKVRRCNKHFSGTCNTCCTYKTLLLINSPLMAPWCWHLIWSVFCDLFCCILISAFFFFLMYGIKKMHGLDYIKLLLLDCRSLIIHQFLHFMWQTGKMVSASVLLYWQSPNSMVWTVNVNVLIPENLVFWDVTLGWVNLFTQHLT